MILNSNRLNVTIESPEHELLLALLERHPDAVQKIGVGVKRFYRGRTDFPTDCFWLERIDGTATDFSYQTAIKAKGKSLYQEFAEACRAAVREELIDAKGEFFKKHGDKEGRVLCELTGEKISIYESHIDHAKPMTFEVLVRTFISAKGIEIRRSMLTEPADSQFQTSFVDDDLREEFRRFHKETVNLRIVKSKVNLSLGGQERIKKIKRPVML